MIDIKLLRENPDKVKDGAHNKGVTVDIGKIVSLDGQVRKLSAEVQELQQKRNQLAKDKNVEEGKKLKEELKEKEQKLHELGPQLKELLFQIPNLPAGDVTIGKNETENEILKKYGEPRKFDFKPRDHVELGKLLDVIDIERASKVSGSRFTYLKNEAVQLEFALVQLALQTLVKNGFTPVIPPVLMKPDHFEGMGRLAGDQKEERYYLPKDDLYLAGSAEHTIGPLHADEILQEDELPKRYVGFSTCFRREAGSYGKDTKGIIRVHQFDKVEMFSFTATQESDKEHEFLLTLQEALMQQLEIPYQVVKMCTADLGFTDAKQYDIETWIPSEDRYRETHSCSNTTDFQARGINAKYRVKGSEKKEYVHMLNATAFAMSRTLVAILENYQQEDGSVVVPEALRKFIGFEKISPKKR